MSHIKIKSINPNNLDNSANPIKNWIQIQILYWENWNFWILYLFLQVVHTVQDVQVRAGRVQVGWLTRVVARVVQHRVVDGQSGHHRVGVQPLTADHLGTLTIIEHPFVVLVPEYVIWVPHTLPDHAFQAHGTTLHHVDVRLAHDLDLWYCKKRTVALQNKYVYNGKILYCIHINQGTVIMWREWGGEGGIGHGTWDCLGFSYIIQDVFSVLLYKRSMCVTNIKYKITRLL